MKFSTILAGFSATAVMAGQAMAHEGHNVSTSMHHAEGAMIVALGAIALGLTYVAFKRFTK